MRTNAWINIELVNQVISKLQTTDVWVIAAYMGIDNQADHARLEAVLAKSNIQAS